MTTRMAGKVVAEKSNLKIRAADGTATASATATAVLWVELNGNGYDKENGLKHGYNGNGKDHLKSGPKLSEELGAPHLAYFIGCVGYFQHLRKKLSVVNWFSFIWLPILLSAPSMLEIIVPLTLDQYKAGGWEIASILNGFQSVALFFCATTTLILSVDKVFLFAGLAGVVSQLSNWGGTSMYLLNKNSLVFDEYEFLWLVRFGRLDLSSEAA